MKKVVRLTESELEKVITKIIKESNESQVVSDFEGLSSMFDNLSKEFEAIKNKNSKSNLKEQTVEDPCASIKFEAGLYLQLVSRSLKLVAEINPKMLMANDFDERLRLSSLQIDAMTLLAKNLNTVKEKLS
jgi:hypothetical protein